MDRDKKKLGRPKKNENEVKRHIATVRMNGETLHFLEDLKKDMNTSVSEVFEMAILYLHSVRKL